jgi:hypothetical protein
MEKSLWPEKLQGPKERSDFRLLNSEDLLSASQFDPRWRACQDRQMLMCCFQVSKVTPGLHYPSLRKGMAEPRTAEITATNFPSPNRELGRRVKAVD